MPAARRVKVNGVTVASGSASGAITLSVGSNAITVVVTAADGTTTKTYSIAVTRTASGNADPYTNPTPVAVTTSGDLVSGLVKEDPADGIPSPTWSSWARAWRR